jgi:hypothetical protein
MRLQHSIIFGTLFHEHKGSIYIQFTCDGYFVYSEWSLLNLCCICHDTVKLGCSLTGNINPGLYVLRDSSVTSIYCMSFAPAQRIVKQLWCTVFWPVFSEKPHLTSKNLKHVNYPTAYEAIQGYTSRLWIFLGKQSSTGHSLLTMQMGIWVIWIFFCQKFVCLSVMSTAETHYKRVLGSSHEEKSSGKDV